MVDIIIWVVLGIVAGSLAKVIMPGPDPGGAGVTILLGIAGAFVGGFVGIFLPFMKSGASANISIGSIFTATVGAIILLAIHRKMKKA